MGDSNEELEPLFDYRRVQPVTFIDLEDDSDSSPSISSKRRKISANNNEENNCDKGKSVQVIECDDEDEEKENLLPPPPKNVAPSKIHEDPTIKKLRLKKKELESFIQATGNAMRAVEEATSKPFTSLSHSVVEETAEETSRPVTDRTKIVITMQDKAGSKQYRVFADEKFEQLFMKYAQKVKIDLHNLVFTFDGDKINPASTAQTLGMEDDDLIEVHVKSS